ncbi:MAG: aspartate-semialdehyde dehydrogenase [Rickettsiaceae bacterium]
MTRKYSVAVVGATGSVGSKILQLLSEQDFPIKEIYAIGSKSSAIREVPFGYDMLTVQVIDDVDFSSVDISFFAVNDNVSKKYAPIVASKGSVVIDKSTYFRYDDQVPLVVPEANLSSMKAYSNKNIISNPNCCVIPLAVALKPLDNLAKIKRLVISTYQSASGVGKAGMQELYNNTKAKYTSSEVQPDVFPDQIAFNLFPCIGDFGADGYCDEETKISLELQKIIGSHIKSTVTCVRVPVFIGHCMSVNVEFKDKIDAKDAIEVLKESDGISVISSKLKPYITSIDCVGKEEVFVSRIRNDLSCANSINLWITADNLFKGAALNAVQIAQELISEYLI